MSSEGPATEVAFEISPEAESVRLARERVVEVAEVHLSPTRQAQLKVVASEVITNAVRHGSETQPVHVRALLCDGFVCVKVTDEGGGIAPTPRATAPDRDGGFGLVLVETLSRRWGMTREAGRTRIWFEFDLDS